MNFYKVKIMLVCSIHIMAARAARGAPWLLVVVVSNLGPE